MSIPIISGEITHHEVFCTDKIFPCKVHCYCVVSRLNGRVFREYVLQQYSISSICCLSTPSTQQLISPCFALRPAEILVMNFEMNLLIHKTKNI